MSPWAFTSKPSPATEPSPNDLEEFSGMKTASYDITSADLLNAIVLGPIRVHLFTLVFDTDSLYDGRTELDATNHLGNWVTAVTGHTGPNVHATYDTGDIGVQYLKTLTQFPYFDPELGLNLRIRIQTQATPYL